VPSTTPVPSRHRERTSFAAGAGADHRDCGDRRSDHARGRRRGADHGSTLIEIVLAIALTGIVVLPLLSAVRTGISASRVNEGAANAETAIVDAADRINRATQACDYTQYVVASVLTKGWDATSASATTQAYDPATGTWKPVGPGSGCLLGGPTDNLVQLVTITITTPKGDVTRRIQVVKSNV
jgi:type II secretory pathway pseudopilin PulG